LGVSPDSCSDQVDLNIASDIRLLRSERKL
jgi:hypothetical protein